MHALRQAMPAAVRATSLSRTAPLAVTLSAACAGASVGGGILLLSAQQQQQSPELRQHEQQAQQPSLPTAASVLAQAPGSAQQQAGSAQQQHPVIPDAVQDNPLRHGISLVRSLFTSHVTPAVEKVSSAKDKFREVDERVTDDLKGAAERVQEIDVARVARTVFFATSGGLVGGWVFRHSPGAMAGGAVAGAAILTFVTHPGLLEDTVATVRGPTRPGEEPTAARQAFFRMRDALIRASKF